MQEIIDVIEGRTADVKFKAFLDAGGAADNGFEYMIFLNSMEKRYLEQFACGKCVCQVHQIMKPRNSEAFDAFVCRQVEKGFSLSLDVGMASNIINPSHYFMGA